MFLWTNFRSKEKQKQRQEKEEEESKKEKNEEKHSKSINTADEVCIYEQGFSICNVGLNQGIIFGTLLNTYLKCLLYIWRQQR